MYQIEGEEPLTNDNEQTDYQTLSQMEGFIFLFAISFGPAYILMGYTDQTDQNDPGEEAGSLAVKISLISIGLIIVMAFINKVATNFLVHVYWKLQLGSF